MSAGEPLYATKYDKRKQEEATVELERRWGVIIERTPDAHPVDGYIVRDGLRIGAFEYKNITKYQARILSNDEDDNPSSVFLNLCKWIAMQEEWRKMREEVAKGQEHRKLIPVQLILVAEDSVRLHMRYMDRYPVTLGKFCFDGREFPEAESRNDQSALCWRMKRKDFEPTFDFDAFR